MLPHLNLCTQEKMGLAPPEYVLHDVPQDLASSVRRGEHCHLNTPDAHICWNGRRCPELASGEFTAGTLEDLNSPAIPDAVLR